MYLHARTKQEYITDIERLYGQGKQEDCLALLNDAFEDHHESEEFRAWCCGFGYAAEYSYIQSLQRKFIENHPQSLFPVKVDYAENLVLNGQVDIGANEARSYLALLHEKKMDEKIRESDMIADAVGRAFLLMTSVYTEMAARSYSIRVLEFALKLSLDDFWKDRLKQEIDHLKEEKSQGVLKDADTKWENFFEGTDDQPKGSGAQDLVVACRAKKFDLLEKRIALLYEIFQEKQHFVCDEEEFFQLVYQTDQGAFVLV